MRKPTKSGHAGGGSTGRGGKRKLLRLAYTVQQLAARVGVGRTLLYREIAAGRLVASKAGRRTLVTRENAQAWLRSLPRA
jgi:excisionase family DNA binding protein